MGLVISLAIFFFFNPQMPSSCTSLASGRGYLGTCWELLRRLDLIAAAAITASLACLSLALQWGGIEYAWNDVRIIALLAVFAISFICIGVHQYFAGEEAIFPVRLLKNKAFAASLLNAFCFGSGQYVILYYVSQRDGTPQSVYGALGPGLNGDRFHRLRSEQELISRTATYMVSGS